MDFSGLLKKKLEQKRQKQKQLETKKQANTQKEDEKVQANVSQRDEPLGSEKPEKDSESETSDDVKDPESEKSHLLKSIDNAKLAESLRVFNETDQTQDSKEEQLRKLEIHVRHEKKDLRYKEYLERENGVEIQIQLPDIVEQRSEKLCLQIRKFFKEILQTWSSQCNDDFPESILLETKRDIVKLLYKLRSGSLAQEMVVSLSTIVYYIQTENIVKANEAYLKLSIGNVAWPIGVRDVGIHARAADSKIAGNDKSQLSNIMKSDVTRRWLIAVKRIVNYCEKLHAKK